MDYGLMDVWPIYAEALVGVRPGKRSHQKLNGCIAISDASEFCLLVYSKCLHIKGDDATSSATADCLPSSVSDE